MADERSTEPTYGGVPYCDLSAYDKERVNDGILESDSQQLANANLWLAEYRQSRSDLMDTNARLLERLAVAESDAAIGRLVRLKLTSGNDIPVERCTIFAHEIEPKGVK